MYVKFEISNSKSRKQDQMWMIRVELSTDNYWDREVYPIVHHGFVLSFILIAVSCGKELKPLSDFTSDGCSLFPDRSIINSDDWCNCCLEHDIAYWQGGTEAQRLEADEKLRDCILKKTGNQALAETMYQGVRFGGSPYFYNWYRWGYGWGYERKYQSLSLTEQRLVSEKLVKYFKQVAQSELPCE